ncbi:hypothetical protein E6P09_00490 [Haloferax mediterranei ATCC 33500]|uniref:Uncharacterized protein n=1 Tax=Haloferax mediterranei (strain ATCC 33500 / DSM 1411 / JCM 8866 / NBRC 14739 / NCIMB 2177 / R-4) TaxID=523841 RepID=I3R6R7_HALMT|nr:hypothetical protein [Haloferax mediterranei]AFK19927.1 hypothetical protein HFX_2239 [Haloferax mediterranei ATCC 33500]MDX5987322.1 hypothetical protein [Haloferax mediterranei ATCC 33500]QCQ73837.1 hypothetical protein E6P09_00490 [Haloferax mediterranei ATCC 33500]
MTVIDPDDATHRLFVCSPNEEANRQRIRAENCLVRTSSHFGDEVRVSVWTEEIQSSKPSIADRLDSEFTHVRESDRILGQDGVEYRAALPDGEPLISDLLSLDNGEDSCLAWRLYGVRHIAVLNKGEWICHVFPESSFERDLRDNTDASSIVYQVEECIQDLDGVGIFPVPYITHWKGEQYRYVLKPTRLGITPIKEDDSPTWIDLNRLSEIHINEQNHTIRFTWQSQNLSSAILSKLVDRNNELPTTVNVEETTDLDLVRNSLSELKATCGYEYKIRIDTVCDEQ